MNKKNNFEVLENTILHSTRDEASEILATLRKESVNKRGEIDLPIYETYLMAQELISSIFPQQENQ